MFKKSLFLLVVVVIVAGGLLAACAQPAPSPVPSPKPSPAPAPAPAPKPSPSPSPTTQPAAKTIQLVYNNPFAADLVQAGQIAEDWAKKIAKATDGRVQIRCVHNGALIKDLETLEGVGKGIADMGNIYIGFHSGKLPLSVSIGTFWDPDLGNKLDLPGVAGITYELFKLFPELRAEYDRQNVMLLFPAPSFAWNMISTKKIQTLADFKGKKIRTVGTHFPKMVQLIGATPVSVAAFEGYTALQTGVIDGFVGSPSNNVATKRSEVAKFDLIFGPEPSWGPMPGFSPTMYIVNKDSWARIPKQDQDIIMKVSLEEALFGSKWMAESDATSFAEEKRLWPWIELVRMPQSEIDKWMAMGPDWYAETVKDLEAKGLPGTAYVNKYKELANAYISGKFKPW